MRWLGLMIAANIAAVTTAAGQWTACDSLPPIGPGVVVDLAGKWRIHFRADSGRATGKTFSANLLLAPAVDSQRSGVNIMGKRYIDSGYVYWGTMSDDLRKLGALRSGDVRSKDPMVPGIRGFVRRERPGTAPFVDVSIELRSAPPHDRWEMVLDGQYTGLQVLALDDQGVSGTWVSTFGEMAVPAKGRFCGRRLQQ